jgi:hypothetical protein
VAGPSRVEVGLTLKLHDAGGDPVGVALFVGGALEELGGGVGSDDALGHEVVPFVPQHAAQRRALR